jgi:adenylosuccinate synthase
MDGSFGAAEAWRLAGHVIVGAQWGDEGKGKIVDFIAPNYGAVARFQGGNNAGHTVKVKDKTYKFQLLPSGAVRGRRVIIGNGVVVDPRVLLKEIEQLEAGSGRKVRLHVSDRAHLILPYHVLLDGAAESEGRKIGTTKRGIGPAYADKARRIGIRMGEFVEPQRFRQRLAEAYPIKRRAMEAHGIQPVPSLDAIRAEYEPLARRLRPYVADTGLLLDGLFRRGQNVLFEGAQGVLLDIDHGTYPYVTSSTTVAANAASGSAVGPHRLGPVLGVAKAYVTRVGEGPFPTEMPTEDGIGKAVLTVGREFGTVTGRPRRIGWLDLVALEYAVRVSGVTHLAITKIDVLNGINQLKVCVGYRRGGRKLAGFPADVEDLAKVDPVYRTLPGWFEAAKRSRGRWQLDAAVRQYLRFIESYVGVPVVVASVGPARDETMVLRANPFLQKAA